MNADPQPWFVQEKILFISYIYLKVLNDTGTYSMISKVFFFLLNTRNVPRYVLVGTYYTANLYTVISFNFWIEDGNNPFS